MTKLKIVLGMAARFSVLGVAPVACGGSGGDGGDDRPARSAPAPAPAKTTSASKPRPKGSTVKVTRTRYGRILADGRGRALYLFTRETGSLSRCYGECAAAWPPFLTRGAPRSGSGAKSALLGTTRRRDGKTQVTYHGEPLYYYVGDRRPGQVLCQGVVQFGGTWLVVAPSGRAVQ
jgi:predicted lipoprotein with Yx(FWY)xxD motif